MEMTFEDGMQESMLPIFEMAVGDDGNVVLEDSNEYAPVFNENGPIEPDEIGAFVKDPQTGETVLLRDNICDIHDYMEAEDDVGKLTSFLR